MKPMPLLKAVCLAALVLCAGSVNAQSPWPTPETEHEWGLAIIDVETTGLDPAYAEMIDIGAIYTDLDGNELGRFFMRMMPPHPERIHPAAAAVNAFSHERWKELGVPDEGFVAERFLEFHEEMAKDRRFIFTAYNTPFDKGFVDAWLKRNDSGFDSLYVYMPLDLPSLAWGQGLRLMGGSQVARTVGIEEEVSVPELHTGETGAEWNLLFYRTLLERAKAERAGAADR